MNKRTDLRNVYVVDDNRDVRRSLSYMLSASDTPSRPFGSGQDFLDALVGHDGRQPVGAEQQAIARLQRHFLDVDLGILAAREGARHDVAPRMLASLER